MTSATDAAVIAGPTSRRTHAQTVTAAFVDQARRFPDLPFVITPDDQTLDFQTVHSRSVAVAAGLLSKGLQTGDRVAFMAANRPELIEITLGPAHAGMITVPINIFLRGEFLRHQLVNSAAAAIAVDQVGMNALLPLLDDLPHLRVLVLLDDDLDVSAFSGTVLKYAELLSSGEHFEIHQPDPLDTFLILYTSGTTGPSKGCMLSHAYMLRVARIMTKMLVLDDDDIQICVHPAFHMSGQMDILIALSTGTPLGIEPRFSASRFFARAKRLGATYWGGPGITDYLLNQPATRDHQLRRWIGIPFPPEKARLFHEKFGIRSIAQMYAQTEANPVSIAGLLDPAPEGTDGNITADIECRVVDDADNPVPTGQVGEIVIRPRVPGAIFSGYWNDAQGTLDCWRNMWHHTGDLGRLDADGALTYVDRKKDAMRRKGENVSAMELERALLQFDQIAEVAAHSVRVAGEDDEHIKACIVVKPGSNFDRERYAKFLMVHVPHYAVPRYYELIEALPRNPIGRVLKFELRSIGVNDQTHDLFSLGLAHDRRRD